MKHDELRAFPEADLFAAISGAVTSALPADASFRAAVRRGIQERHEAFTSGWDRLPGLGWLRAAASLLPVGVAPQAFAGAGWKSPAVKGLLGKSLGAALVPVFIGGLAVASFTSSLNRTVGLNGTRGRIQSDRLGQREFTSWVSAHRWAAAGILLFLALLLFISPLDAGVFVIAASMLSTALVARRLSDQGLADRKALGPHIVGSTMQMMLLLSFIGIVAFERRSGGSALMTITAYGVAMLAVIGTAPFQSRRWFAKGTPLTPRLRRMDAALSVLMATMLAGCWLMLLGIGRPGHFLMDALSTADLHPVALRLPLVALLYVVFVTAVMARAPMPRPRGRRSVVGGNNAPTRE